MSFETDPILAALAGDRVALLNKLNQPSTDQLTAASADKTAQPTAEPTQESTESSSKPSDALAPKNNDDDARPASQNRSVTAVSLNNAPDSWLKAILRSVFAGFFGAIFSPFRRGKSSN
jgi:hypothetical protein